MKIKDVVGECLVKMGQTDFSNEQTLDEQQTELKNKLLASINIIYSERIFAAVSYGNGKFFGRKSQLVRFDEKNPLSRQGCQKQPKAKFLFGSGRGVLRYRGRGSTHVCVYAVCAACLYGRDKRYATYRRRTVRRRTRRILLSKQNVRPCKKFRLRFQSANRSAEIQGQKRSRQS